MMTLRFVFHPDDRHGTQQVSGRADDGSGPSISNRSRMSSRHASLAVIQSRCFFCQPVSALPSRHSAISAW
jgi:hypothetical protein